ncbi:MAG TPA: hypothetical protein VGM78_01785 [Ilumatobacteraceae bacterium]
MSDAAVSNGRGGLDIIVRGPVLQQIDEHMTANSHEERGGVLIGNASPKAGLVMVTAAISVESAASSAGGPDGSFTFDAASYDDVARRAARVYPNQRIVGWYHSRPGAGVYYSPAEHELQAAFFAQPWQVGYVFDPIVGHRGFFGWSGGAITRIPSWETTSAELGIAATVPVDDPNVAPDSTGEMSSWPAPMAETEPALSDPTGGFAGDVSAVDSSSPDDAAQGLSISSVVPTDFGAYPMVQAGEDTGVGVEPTPMYTPAPFATPYDAPPSTSAKQPIKESTIGVIAGLIVAVIIIVVVIATSGSDSKSPATTLPTSKTTVGVVTTNPTATTKPGQTTSSSSTAATTGTPSTATLTSTPSSSTLPATTGVATPIQRVGALPTCPLSGDHYAPSVDCDVPLSNGNIVVYKGGALTCANPAGTVLAATAAQFTIGTLGSQAMTADGKAVAGCTDLTYVKTVLAGGASTMAGLCGSSSTPIDSSAVRCFAANTTTGAVLAMVKAGTPVDLVAACYDNGSSNVNAMKWNVSGVSLRWHVDSVVYSPSTKLFVVTASRQGVIATASVACT